MVRRRLTDSTDELVIGCPYERENTAPELPQPIIGQDHRRFFAFELIAFDVRLEAFDP